MLLFQFLVMLAADILGVWSQYHGTAAPADAVIGPALIFTIIAAVWVLLSATTAPMMAAVAASLWIMNTTASQGFFTPASMWLSLVVLFVASMIFVLTWASNYQGDGMGGEGKAFWASVSYTTGTVLGFFLYESSFIGIGPLHGWAYVLPFIGWVMAAVLLSDSELTDGVESNYIH